MKHLLLSLCFLASMAFASCQKEKKEPQAEIGWNGTEKVVKVTDDNGQSFLMTYLLYQTLFSQGGYNNVIHHYHSNPTSSGYIKDHSRFKGNGNVVTLNKTSPVVKKAHRSATVARAATIYKPKRVSLYKPVSFVKKTSYTSPSRSTYRSSFRSSFRSSSRRR